jgi:hypothetical protein
MSSQSIVGNLAVELGISDAQLQAGLAQAVTQAQQAGQKMANAMNQGQKQGGGGYQKNTAMGILAISRAVDDAQYGFRGVINNVEQIALGFGAGAGVAGMATMAAVAIAALEPAFSSVLTEAQKFFGYFQDATEQARTSVSGMMGGGFGTQAISESFKQRAEFLRGRTDEVGGTNIDFISRAMGFQSVDQAAMENNMRRSIEAAALMQQGFRLAADASRELAASQRGASAQYDLTTAQKGQIPLNQQLFQAAVDKFGGGDNLRTRIKIGGMNQGMLPSETENLYGQFAAGNAGATNQVTEMLGLQAERTKIMADDFERMTGSAEELRRISEDTAQSQEETAKFIEQENRWMERAVELDAQREKIRQGRILDRQFGEYERAVGQQDNLFRQRDAIMLERSRSEILGSAADVFGRNLNAGMEDPQLKKLDEIKEEIKNLGTLTGLG